MRKWLRIDDALVLRVAIFACLVALVFRVWPIVIGMPAVAQFFVTEDGYLMLTVARNLAIGLGLSVSEGTIATNGVQPLATLIYALTYVFTGGDKVVSLYFLHVIWTLIALAGAFAVRALAARILGPMGLAPVWSWFAAALWFSGPLLTRHTMNGLETGLYTLLILLACLQFMRVVERGASVDVGNLLVMAMTLGLVFLGRNDGVFLVLSFTGVWVAHALITLGLGIKEVVRRLVAPAVLCAAVVAPWLIHNQILFGSIVPGSGPAQSMTASFGANVALIPIVLFEQMFPMLPLPSRIQTMPLVIAATCLAVVVIMAAFTRKAWRMGGSVRLLMLAYLMYAVAISFYYGFFFGAPHFMSRYTAPLAPLMIISLVSFVWDLMQRIGRQRGEAPMAVMAIFAMLLSLALLGRLLLPNTNVHGHFQVVDWVDRNVPADTWVGAVQTGTLGYWHDRTINLDGKVNPEALQARREQGSVLDYVVESEISYLADWVGIAVWIEEKSFDAHFEVIVRDPKANLTVMRRR